MNALYHIAILEGYLSQHNELPRNVQDSLEFFKIEHLKTENSAATNMKPQKVKKRKKTKLSPEERQRMLDKLANMRATHQANLEARWTPELKEKIRSGIAEGKTGEAIAKSLGLPPSAVYSAIHKYDLR